MAPALDGVGATALERIQRAGADPGRVGGPPARSCGSCCRSTGTRTATPIPDRGLLVLPEPSPGDLFLDLEGDPFALDDGVDYLFGILEPRLPEDGRFAAPDGEPCRSSTRSGASTTTGS